MLTSRIRPAVATSAIEFTPAGPGIVALARRLAAKLGLWRERSRMRRQLRELDERLIADIGLTVGEAQAEYAKFFWMD